MVLGIKNKFQAVNSLKKNGFYIIENFWSLQKCDQAVREILSLNQDLFDPGQGGDSRCQHSNKYLKTSCEFLDDSFIQSVADDYSKCNLANRTVAGIVEHKNTQSTDSGGGWHVDSEEGSQFKSFMYLTDVGRENGPLTFIKKSKDIVKKVPKYSNLRILEEDIYRYFDLKNIVEITGSAGTCILADSTYPHRGKQIQSGIRCTYTTYFYFK
jgi:hypothetical protein